MASKPHKVAGLLDDVAVAGGVEEGRPEGWWEVALSSNTIGGTLLVSLCIRSANDLGRDVCGLALTLEISEGKDVELGVRA